MFPLTTRQRIGVYVVLAALAGLACAGVDFEIDANRMSADVPTSGLAACLTAQREYRCADNPTWEDGTCHLSACLRPPAAPSKPVTNCPFGSTNQNRPWSQTDCRARALQSGCTEGTLFSFGCYGYTCTNTRCTQ